MEAATFRFRKETIKRIFVKYFKNKVELMSSISDEKYINE